MRDYTGNFAKYQKMIDEAGIVWDVGWLSGCTEPEIENYVEYVIDAYKRGVNIYEFLPGET